MIVPNRPLSSLGLVLIIGGLVVFWPAVLIGIRHIIHDGLAVGLIDTAALLTAATGYILFRFEAAGLRRAIFESFFLFMDLNLLIFEIQLYFHPYPNYWWTRQASDWIAMIGFGGIITNELVFAVCLSITAISLPLFLREKINARNKKMFAQSPDY
jgi:hypothetical protein